MNADVKTFRDVPYMGVIYVVAEAAKLGFTNGDPDWCNLGQGQPEVGPLTGAPPRLAAAELTPGDHAYGPVAGHYPLREAIAEYYNRLYRVGYRSRYRAENVAIASGGRLALSRLLATLGPVRVGYQTPDYTAYEDLLAYHAHRIVPVHVPTSAAEGFKVSPERFTRLVREQELDAYLVSNPCNPTGQVIAGEELASYVRTARETGCALLLDEFYSHFMYEPDGSPRANAVSAAQVIDDVEHDPVLIVDGLTKNFRYPGWRVGWTVGPAEWIERLTRAASAIDGGPSTAAQRLALQVLEPQRADQETRAVREAFARKRALMMRELTQLGVDIPCAPLSTFYVWGNIAKLPEPLNDADRLFTAALREKVMIVPGRFFDVNPGGTRSSDPQSQHWVRFSFGPPEDNVRLGLARLRTVVARARRRVSEGA